MKKHLRLFAVLMLLLCLIGCGNKTDHADSKPVLNIYNWTYYIPDAVIKSFEAKYNVKVVYDMYSSNEEMYAKLKAGGKGYDLVFPSEDFVKIMIKGGMLEKLDKSQVPNFKNLDPAILKKIYYDPGNEYSIPFMMGAAGIAVNKIKVAKYEKSVSILNNNDLKGRVTLLDDMREVLGLALKSLGYSVNTTKESELKEAQKIVLGWRENIVRFDSESFGKGFAAGEFWVVHGYAENVFLELDKSKESEVEFFIPKEGGPMYIDSMVILKGSKNLELAYKFMNYIHDPEVFAQIADFLRIPAINIAARPLIKQAPRYTPEDMSRCEIKEDVGEDLDKYNNVWESIRI